MSLSPLYSVFRIDLHVKILMALHDAFASPQPNQAKFVAFRVLPFKLKLYASPKFSAARIAGQKGLHACHFHFSNGFSTLQIA
jgi:hypothetical protein